MEKQTEVGAPDAPRSKRRKRIDPDIEALAKFTKALDREDQSSQLAAISYLASRYLGIRLSRYM